MTGISRRLAEFAVNLGYEDLPTDVIERTKLLILDTAGIMVRARNDAESTPAMVRALEYLGLASGDCAVPGDAKTYAPSAAALLNGTLAHSLDFDDTHAEASLHSSAPIVPAALAAAEMTGASGKDLIAACVAGYEIQIRLSLALGPSDHYDRGYHPTATCGIFGAVAAAGKLLGMDADQIESGFGIALSQAAGSMQFLADGAWTKRSHVGQAAQNGLMCAVLAKEGFQGPKEAFEGKWGFLHAYAPNADPAKADAELGERWETLRLAVKPYPSCRYTHAAMDAIKQIMRDEGVTADEVEAVEIGLPLTGMKIVSFPEEAKHNPESVVDGQFSMPFCAAVVLREGTMLWDHYATHLKDPETLALTKKVTCVNDPEVEALFPANMAGKATVKTPRGTFSVLVDMPKGEPANFMTVDEFRGKFSGLASPYLGEEGVNRFADLILGLEAQNSVSSVLAAGKPQMQAAE
ncbi:MAG: MmgE/PrpD family protein [Rhodospirillales bacterium]|nr:MmgE/PrpD family protein [Rhodospirillales bacterium]MBO6786309.1 MmgE/PrpD family protein [Rhodospirillales bacterium]